MIISSNLKLCILLTSKTGSRTLTQLIKNINPILDNIFEFPNDVWQSNAPLWRIGELYPNVTDIQTYRVVGFYRNPVERFLSGMAYAIRTHSEPIPTNISVDDFIDEFGIISPQINFLEPSTRRIPIDVTVELYNFHDYTNEIIRLAATFGYILDPDQIPKLNVSENRKQESDLTPAELARIRGAYAEDYVFFASRGIVI